jgi:hypothetical protein
LLTKSQMLIIVALVFLNAAVLAGVVTLFTATPAAPEAAPVTPTTVAEAPTSTPTATPAPPTATATLVMAEPKPTSAAAGAIMEAMSKGKTAKSYRIDMSMSMKGDFGQLTAGSAKNQEVSLFSMSGEINGDDSHLIMKGIVGAMFSGDPSKGVEMTSLAGKSYVRGPAPLLGAKDNRWYVLNASDAASTKSKLGSADIYGNFLGKDQDLSVFAPAGTETLDGTKCSVYGANKQDALNALLGMGATSEIGQGEWSLIQDNIQSSEYKIWVCDDGYLHQMRINIQAQDQRQPQQAFGMKLLLHAYDFGSNLKVTVPANAIPAVSPFIQTEVPTRTN